MENNMTSGFSMLKFLFHPRQLFLRIFLKPRWRMSSLRLHLKFRYILVALTVFLWLTFILYTRISDHNAVAANTKRWATFMTVLRGASPDSSTLTFSKKPIDNVLNFENVSNTTLRLDTVHMAPNSFKITKAAHDLVVAIIPEYANLGNYNPGTRGIVTVGGGKFFPVVLVSLRMLRRKGSILPVEVFVPERDYYDPYICDTLLPELNARCITRPKFDNVRISKYQYKVFAVLFSSFEDVLFLDADCIPVVDPAEYFISEPFLSTGLVTWPDFWVSTVSPLYYQLVGKEEPSLMERPTTEAGQMLFSKRRHAKTVLLAVYYNLHGPSIYYKLFSQGAPGEGDKDTFLAAGSVFDLPFYQIGRKPDVIGYMGRARKKGWQGIAMLQRHPGEDYRNHQSGNIDAVEKERIAFIHQNAVKLNPKGLVGRLDGTRMWGSKEDTVSRFGYDLERELWQEIIHVGCVYGGKLWWNSATVCKGLRTFWNKIIDDEMAG